MTRSSRGRTVKLAAWRPTGFCQSVLAILGDSANSNRPTVSIDPDLFEQSAWCITKVAASHGPDCKLDRDAGL
jgi:hypothetical protein